VKKLAFMLLVDAALCFPVFVAVVVMLGYGKD